MKFKINKACDLSSISVLPPQIRRLNTGASGQQHMSQNRSQQSQQSLSQSQNGNLSQFSQNSLDDIVTNDQRFSSQDKESSGKRLSCTGMMNNHHEESQKLLIRPSTDILRKWSSSSASANRPISEALEQRIGKMEISVTRLGIILDSVQSDVLQVNKGTKEVSQELEGIKQKLNVIEDSLQYLKKRQQDTKDSLDGSLKDICDQLSKDVCQGKLQETLLEVSVLPDRIETSFMRLQNFIVDTFTKELQDATCLMKFNKKKEPLKTTGVPMVVSHSSSSPEIQVGGWKSVKRERGTITYNGSHKMHRQNGVSVIEQEREWKVTIDSDEDIEGGFSCLLKEKESSIMEECMIDAKAETERILRSARRRKRRISNTIIIN